MYISLEMQFMSLFFCIQALCYVCVFFRREGEGVRVFWDKLREPSFTSRWNPFSVEYPFTTFTYHPVKSANEELGRMCDVSITMQHTPNFYHSQVSCHTFDIFL